MASTSHDLPPPEMNHALHVPLPSPSFLMQLAVHLRCTFNEKFGVQAGVRVVSHTNLKLQCPAVGMRQ